VAKLGTQVDVTFCPERIAEGKAMTELYELPQIVSGRCDAVLERAEKLFRNLASQMVRLTPRKQSWPSSSPTPGATSSSPPPINSS